LITFIIGTGSVPACSPPRCRQSGCPASAAAAFAAAREPPRRVYRASLFRRAVELDQAVERLLIPYVRAADRYGDLGVDVGNGVSDALAAPRLPAVAELDRLVRAGRRARRHRGAAACARFEDNVHLNRRIAARVEHLPTHDRCDSRHAPASFSFALS
jgi:hypothetical protein